MQSKIFFPFQKFSFFTSLLHFIVEKCFSWAVKKKTMMAMILAPFVGWPLVHERCLEAVDRAKGGL
jgi:hypothetical protein